VREVLPKKANNRPNEKLRTGWGGKKTNEGHTCLKKKKKTGLPCMVPFGKEENEKVKEKKKSPSAKQGKEKQQKPGFSNEKKGERDVVVKNLRGGGEGEGKI